MVMTPVDDIFDIFEVIWAVLGESDWLDWAAFRSDCGIDKRNGGFVMARLGDGQCPPPIIRDWAAFRSNCGIDKRNGGYVMARLGDGQCPSPIIRYRKWYLEDEMRKSMGSHPKKGAGTMAMALLWGSSGVNIAE
jgi:hypothetical protein